jgi:hypothetical protein
MFDDESGPVMCGYTEGVEGKVSKLGRACTVYAK